ncbi:aminodeoxychorismate/anthranilate synthase component II [Candidatus Peregrinibacteria bacterium]|mgnify:CR=1 FL=1|jgi:anthranilate synthase/aminodeoxychorismate synthase-like glutamine amidotransferase|nr:aminodeoxychorismate/anthranilate synthase component II [Candidatus Peregrinibacteria bacterium]MBT7736117.1 aminodeoxychorismate/anthranilate synthase component II [Candidatus Peregrinibacteria bacterium]
MILLIDNYDSFTFNLYQQIESLGKKVKVIKNDELNLSGIKKLSPEKIIISPGPGRPEESGISKKVVQEFYTEIPILGVCLGHQLIAQIFSSKIAHAPRILHGKTSEVFHTEDSLFQNVKNPFIAARYHSLIAKTVPKEFELTAWTKEKEIMGIKHKKHPLFGLQFHPESFLTNEGNKIMKNFLYEI